MPSAASASKTAYGPLLADSMPILEKQLCKRRLGERRYIWKFLINVLFGIIKEPSESAVTLLGGRDVREASSNGLVAVSPAGTKNRVKPTG